MSAFTEWVCVFPGKMGISWKEVGYYPMSKEHAELVASKNCNTVAIPLNLFQHIRDNELKLMAAEKKLREIQLILRTTP